MRYTPFATLFGYLVLALSSALAQTTTPPGTAPGTASTPGAGAGAGATGGRGRPCRLVVDHPGAFGGGCRDLVLHERSIRARLIWPVPTCADGLVPHPAYPTSALARWYYPRKLLLPAPKGPFSMIMRLYWPKPEALEGKWTAPPLKRVT